MNFAIVVFPGSNCDHDAYHAAKHVLGQDADFVWHKDRSLAGADVVILPGGFSHGDYLRTGAIARFSPVMESVRTCAASGGPVLGICNGFHNLRRIDRRSHVHALIESIADLQLSGALHEPFNKL